jgi:hypothetical protein
MGATHRSVTEPDHFLHSSPVPKGGCRGAVFCFNYSLILNKLKVFDVLYGFKRFMH